MATTMGTADGSHKSKNAALYWIVAAVAVCVLAIFFMMRPRTIGTGSSTSGSNTPAAGTMERNGTATDTGKGTDGDTTTTRP